MASDAGRTGFRRILVYGAILLALCLVTTVIIVVTNEDSDFAREDVFPELVLIDIDKRPKIVFPENLRSYDLSLNRFIDRFARVCSEGKYSEFRLLFSTQSGDPILPDRFASIFSALKEIRIVEVKKLPELPQVEGPVYLLTAEYALEDFVPRSAEGPLQAKLAVHKEADDWRIGPLPREAMEQLALLMSRVTTQPADAVPPEKELDAAALADSPDWEVPKASANQAVRIER